MKSVKLLAVLAAATLFTHTARADAPPPGFIDFGTLAPSGDSTFVEVNLKRNLLQLAARLTERHEPEVAKLLRSIHSVRVNVVGMNQENRTAVRQQIEAVRRQLNASDWERVVTAQEKKQDVGVYIKPRNDEAVDGIVVTVIQGDREAVFVNVVGDIRPDQLAKIGESLNIRPLKKLGRKLEKEEPAK
jgi:Domain of unknown function (DUF4252)